VVVRILWTLLGDIPARARTLNSKGDPDVDYC
jgi:hypothetical protein